MRRLHLLLPNNRLNSTFLAALQRSRFPAKSLIPGLWIAQLNQHSVPPDYCLGKGFCYQVCLVQNRTLARHYFDRSYGFLGQLHFLSRRETHPPVRRLHPCPQPAPAREFALESCLLFPTQSRHPPLIAQQALKPEYFSLKPHLYLSTDYSINYRRIFINITF